MRKPSKATFAAALATIGAAGLAAGALAQVPPDIAARIAEIGRVVDPPATARIYAPLQQAAPRQDVRTTRNIPYGPGPKDVLDVFTSPRKLPPRPILIFVHGGAFVGGDKSRNPDGEPSPFYDNIMLWAVGHGMVGVNMNYPLAPQARYPVVQHDIAEVVAWARKNAASFGGDPSRVFLWGHSAGASHVAAFIAHPEAYPDIPSAQGAAAGAILTSGGYALANPDKPADHVYFGEAATLAERSATDGLVRSRTPLFVIAAELDPEAMVVQAKALDGALTAAGRDHAFLIAAKHGHMSEAYAVNTGDQSVSGPVLAFIRQHGG
jgi:acetyl esterase/lipase